MEGYIFHVIIAAIVLLFPVWKIFERAGLHPALSLTIFIPFLGIFIAGIILAVSDWNINSGKGER